jgi:peptide/nickel transport system permease protein
MSIRGVGETDRERIDVATADLDIYAAPPTVAELDVFDAEAHRPAPSGRGVAGFLRRCWALPNGIKIGGGIVVAFILIAVLAPVLAPYGPQDGELTDRLQGVGTAGHLLGTDGQGRDLLSRLIWGARPSLVAGITPVLVAAVVGMTLGLVAGLGHRRTHALVMRTLDVVYAFPAVLLAISIAAALGVGVTNVIIALSIVLIAPIARVVETEVLRVRTADFMEAARASGAAAVVTATRQVVPNILPTLIVYCTSLIGLAIVYAAGLSFLGLGVAPPNPEWGAILNDLRQNLYDEPMLALVPAVVIFVASVGFNVLGDGMRELLDVKEMA